MRQERPLAHLATYVAAARARGRPTRLVLRNTERLGVVHLYFQNGQLVSVEGHRGSSRANLEDIITWQQGTVRQDDLENQPVRTDPDPALEQVLADVLQRIKLHFGPPSGPSGTSMPSRPEHRSSDPHISAITSSLPPLTRPTPAIPREFLGQDGTPSAPTTTPIAAISAEGSTQRLPTPGSHTSGSPQARPAGRPTTPLSSIPSTPTAHLTAPQWQLIALAMHQVVERARHDMGNEVAEGLLYQALGHLAPQFGVLREVELEPSGWLHTRHERFTEQFPAYEIAQAIASLLVEFESRCAVLVGKEGARRIIIEGTGGLRIPLAQVGIDISTG